MVTYNLQVHQYDEYINEEVSLKVDKFDSEQYIEKAIRLS